MSADLERQRALLAWFAAAQRSMPWRHPKPGPHPDPYAVFVSELMLQQTRVDAVIEPFERWMRRFPDLASLAAALFVPAQAEAFCGFYVSGADASLYNNATLVVVGDVSKAQVKAAADKHFGPIPAGKKPPRVTVREGAQTKLRERTANWPSQLAVVLGAYHIPGANSPDMAPLQVLSAILSAGRSSRLHQDVVRKRKLALQAGGFARPQEHPGLMMIYAVGLPSHDVSKMKDALLAEVERVAKSTITKAELKKAKNQLATSRLMSLRTIWGIAYQIGSSAYLKGNPTAFLDEVAKIDRVSAADVKRVAKKYLTRENLSILLLPPGQGGGK